MQIINFQETKARKQAKAKKQSKEKATKYLPGINDGVLELQRQYREYAEFCNRWYDEHVIGQDKDGSWIYKDL
ncbi:MAG: hypothetical protein K1W35_06590 [Lachnospiraceae bacterium]